MLQIEQRNEGLAPNVLKKEKGSVRSTNPVPPLVRLVLRALAVTSLPPIENSATS